MTTKNLFDKRAGKTVVLYDPHFSRSIGEAELKGGWLIYGAEKNGKTWLTLRLARDLAAAPGQKVAFVSAEEGTDESFKQACYRAGITRDTPIIWEEYLTVNQIVEHYSKPRTANIIFIDNLTIYKNELAGLRIKNDLLDRLPHKLIVFVAHEERKEPSPGCAKMARKLCKVNINVVGLKAFVVSRFAPQGGEIVISEDLSEMYWGLDTE